MDFDYISELLMKLTLAILPVLLAQGSAFLLAMYKVKRAEVGEKQQWLVDMAVSTAVFAAEQLYKSGDGDVKKAYALDVAEKWLAGHSIKLDLDVLAAEIEAAVKAEFGKA